MLDKLTYFVKRQKEVYGTVKIPLSGGIGRHEGLKIP